MSSPLPSLLVASLMALVASACTPPADQPTEPVWGKEACSHCNMILSDKSSSAQLITREGVRRYFDDVGCMAEAIDKGHLQVAYAWAHRGTGEGWISIQEARFSGGHRTPMDFGFIADDNGAVRWSDVVTAVQQKQRDSAARMP